MKRISCFRYVLVCMLFVGVTACNKDNREIEKEIPVAIKSDFSKRYSSSKITTVYNSSEGISQIDFIDKEQNPASAWYMGETWKMTSVEINNIFQLPSDVQLAFANSGYGDAQILAIYKTEREGMEKALYTFCFQYRWKNIDNLEHYVFINDDGLFLATFTSRPNDSRKIVNLPEDHFDFIAEKYKGAEIRGYVNNGGSHEYFIFHDNTIKYVFFRGEVAEDRGFWHKTIYELSINTEIPDNVIRVLKRDHPDFTYTTIYYVETDEGNRYFFQDKNLENELGYSISEHISSATSLPYNIYR